MSKQPTLPTMLVPAVDHVKAGADMRAEREAEKIPLAEIARRMGISGPYLTDLEFGRRNWTVAKVIAFRRALRQAVTDRKKSEAGK